MAGVVAARQLVVLSKTSKQATLLAGAGVNKVSLVRSEDPILSLPSGDVSQDAQQDFG